ncbi:MAG: hypothetical protein B6U85_05405 [Desulfurococcales archaeon ex4484_42]|nr:MAG: hypothetical protein B6U85_05405 [Desulfurococcales archaeon ex4484_42]
MLERFKAISAPKYSGNTSEYNLESLVLHDILFSSTERTILLRVLLVALITMQKSEVESLDMEKQWRSTMP